MSEAIEAVIQCAVEVFAPRVPLFEFDHKAVWPGADLPGRETSGRDAASNPAELLARADRSGVERSSPDGTMRVDQVEDLAQLPWPNGVARTVICRGALEHVFEPRRAIDEMIRILKPGGMLIVASQPQPSPREAVDRYWELTPVALQRLLGELPSSVVGWQGEESSPGLVFGVACREPVPGEFAAGVHSFAELVQERLRASSDRLGWLGRLGRLLGAGLFHAGRVGNRVNNPSGPVGLVFHLPLGARTKKEVLATLSKPASGSRLDVSR